jgi:hypothetical protein
MSNDPPKTITQLWYLLDKRLALIEAAQAAHTLTHAELKQVLDDHEARLRSGMTFTGITTGSGGLLALIALVKSFIS